MRLQKIDQTGKPYRIYAEALESQAIDQFVLAMQQPEVVQGALMPDAHAGYTLPIGAVVATHGKVFPAYVGYDIGCGLCAMKTTFNADDVRANQDAIFNSIYELLPVGFAHNKIAGPGWEYQGPRSKFAQTLDGLVASSEGSLGSGNHFAEAGVDEDGAVWIVVHSGSRQVGHQIASHYMAIAAGGASDTEGHFGLDPLTDVGRDYVLDLEFALQFALVNRHKIVARTAAAMAKVISGELLPTTLINRNHNHAERKLELGADGLPTGRTLWIHRKGATHAEAGMLGIVPGNMKDGSFLVRGKGHPDSLCSSSHGAGRCMSRSQAKKRLDLTTFAEEMAAMGIKARVDAGTLDEAPEAYKDIYEVMRQQADLVEVIHHIKPLINIKG